eukprot:scaffold2897_cov171-Ochromonas_danica.AAC.1
MCLVEESSKLLSDSGGEALFPSDLTGNNNNHKKDEGLTLVNSKVCWSARMLSALEMVRLSAFPGMSPRLRDLLLPDPSCRRFPWKWRL